MKVVTLVGGPADGREVVAQIPGRYVAYQRGRFITYRRERVGFVVPKHHARLVLAALAGLNYRHRELVDMMTGESAAHTEVEVWSLPDRFDAIRVELARVNEAMAPLMFVDAHDDGPLARELEATARERLEALAELMRPGHEG